MTGPQPTTPERPPVTATTTAAAPKEGAATPASKPKESADKDKEKDKAKKDLTKLLGEGIAGDLTKGLKSYGKFIEALEKLGAVDILDLIRKGFNVWQIEAEIKKQLEGKLLSSSEISTLKTDEGEMTKALAGEKDGDYVLRCLKLKQPKLENGKENETTLVSIKGKYDLIPKRSDGKENDPTMVSMIWLKTSGVMNLLAYNAIKDGLMANPQTKKPILYKNDLVYITTGEKKYAAGFVKEIDLENDKIKLSTIENGSVVIKEFNLKDALMAFHLAGNTKIMPKSLDNLEKDKKDEKPADTQKPATTPPAAPPAATPPAPPAAKP